MRLYIRKRHHQALLKLVAADLGSDQPTDALEHILNCWIVSRLPTEQEPSAPLEVDPLLGLGEF
jgi:hypothetical protein